MRGQQVGIPYAQVLLSPLERGPRLGEQNQQLRKSISLGNSFRRSCKTPGRCSSREVPLRHPEKSRSRTGPPRSRTSGACIFCVYSEAQLRITCTCLHKVCCHQQRRPEAGESGSITHYPYIDRCWPTQTILRVMKDKQEERRAVSYTHLTLPTKA